jgi:hypothetical protein
MKMPVRFDYDNSCRENKHIECSGVAVFIFSSTTPDVNGVLPAYTERYNPPKPYGKCNCICHHPLA